MAIKGAILHGRPLRTGHCSLNRCHERFNIIVESTCECGKGKETVKHFLLVCPKHEGEGDKLKGVGMQGMNVEKLLRDMKRIRDKMKFVARTKRFYF